MISSYFEILMAIMFGMGVGALIVLIPYEREIERLKQKKIIFKTHS